MSEKNFRQALTFRIEFVEKKPEGDYPPLRVMTVTGDTTLHDFAAQITVLFGLEFTRAFGFYSNVEDWRDSKEQYELYADLEEDPDPRAESVKKTPVDAAFRQAGQKLLFLFDYGEEMKFTIELVRTGAIQEGETYPILEDALGSVPGEPEVSPMVHLAEDGTDLTGRHYYELEEESFERLVNLFRVEDRTSLPKVKPWSLEVFYDHLIQNVKFPFYGVYGEQKGDGEMNYHNVQVNSIQDPDSTEELDKFGLLCNVEINEKEAMMPLAEIVINQGDPNYSHVEDYAIWYWDFREPPER